uniref:Uncharacterized protein n=1 Tax=viral metagenome TaxID=1070528 RepID=A0A6M3L2M7_9ZZZZ
MKVQHILDEIEISLNELGRSAVDRGLLLRHMSFDLSELVNNGEWDWSMVHLDPILSLVESQRDYTLPDDFPDNFVRGAGDRGDKFCCKLDNETNETLLDYLVPSQFYSKDLLAETDGTPRYYTISAVTGGRRRLSLSPPPDDAATYTIDGLYIPQNYELDYEDDLPPMPNPTILKYTILRRYAPSVYDVPYQQALAAMHMAQARNRRGQLIPKFESYWGQAGLSRR